MTNPFEQLEQNLVDIANKLQSLESKIQHEKRWLSTAELSNYIPYSKETINKKVQSGEFEHGVHFYQQAKMRMFDKIKIDEWIMSNRLSSHNELKKQEILSKIQADF
ncbi:MAG: helix-turn-helix domain-containing protein [Arcobacteraceae bacterium]|nr:helix-turn-helix domain-containing protein [Arcobacteraceae bacterium]